MLICVVVLRTAQNKRVRYCVDRQVTLKSAQCRYRLHFPVLLCNCFYRATLCLSDDACWTVRRPQWTATSKDQRINTLIGSSTSATAAWLDLLAPPDSSKETCCGFLD